MNEPEMKNKIEIKAMGKHRLLIIKVQSIWRGIKIRKEIRQARSSLMHTSKFATVDQITPHLNWKVLNIINSLSPFKQDYSNSKKELKKVGPISMENNIIYKGQINDNFQREGFGELFLPDGGKFEGYFKEGKMEGLGRLINIQGDYYEGEFIKDKANGLGKYISNEGVIYNGSWKDDRQHGEGEETYPDKSKYIGGFKDGMKNGKGKFYWPDGSYYEGDLIQNCIQGRGLYKWKDGRIYYGDWKGNKMDGIGVFCWPDKKKFVGMYKDDKKEGYGIFYWPDGRKYEGLWLNGKQHGYGIMFVKNKKKYGEWKNGKKVSWIDENVGEKESNIEKMRSNINTDELLKIFNELNVV